MYEYRFIATTPDGLTIPFTASRPNQKWAVVGQRYATGSVSRSIGLEVLKSASARSTLTNFLDYASKYQERLLKLNPTWSYPDLSLAKVEYQPRQQCVFYIAKRSQSYSEVAQAFPYGDPDCYVTVDTSQWTVKMWECVKYSDSPERSWHYSDIIEHFIEGKHPLVIRDWDNKLACSVCHLTEAELPSTKESTNV